MPHVALLGDSVFDNRSYTNGGPDVVTQLRAMLPAGWRASLAAVDGHTTIEIPRQVAALPDSVTHLALSVGGNDALRCLSVLDAPMADVRQAMTVLGAITEQFEAQYIAALDACRRLNLPTVVCTIYNGCFDDVGFQRVATVFIALFDDVIQRAAARHGLPVVDLRVVCSHPSDYANPIEPSSIGGEKIARALAAALGVPPQPGAA